ncbi:MAG: inositol monophosphatase [Bacteroidetes bacterium]|nr:inositol monophosphatase [Bacteroidota bacterium]
MTDISSLLQPTLDTAARAAAFIRRERSRFSYQKAEIKGLNDLVSYVDRGSEELIVRELALILPEAGFIVEENSASGKKDFNWIVDPLDGTTNFIHGIPCYAVSIALEYKGKIVLGVVHEVSRDECFYAVKGKGAFLNGEPIRVSDRAMLSESLIATGFPIYNFSRLEPFMHTLSHLMKSTHGIRRIGAAAADLCYLACGRVDAFFEYNLNAWDVAAGSLIVEEAGGSVTDFSGGENWLFGKEICCTNGYLKQEFETVIRNHFQA